MAEAAETDNTDVEARSVEAEEPHGAVDGDAGAEKRRGGVKRESAGDAEDIALVNDDGVGEAAVGGWAIVVGAVVGQHPSATVALEVLLALLAVVAAANEAAHASFISKLELLYFLAGFHHLADDLMPGIGGL